MRNRPIGVPTSSSVAGPQVCGEIARHAAAGLHPDAQLERAAARRRDDGIGAALLAIVDHAPHGDVLAGVKRKGLAQRGRDLDGHAGGILGDALDRGDFQRMKAQARDHVKCT